MSLNSLLILKLNSYYLRSSSLNPLMLPFFNKLSNLFDFFLAAPFLWNHLPNSICSATYLPFRKNLKTCFVNQAFPHIDYLPLINLTFLVLTVLCKLDFF